MILKFYKLALFATLYLGWMFSVTAADAPTNAPAAKPKPKAPPHSYGPEAAAADTKKLATSA